MDQPALSQLISSTILPSAELEMVTNSTISQLISSTILPSAEPEMVTNSTISQSISSTLLPSAGPELVNNSITVPIHITSWASSLDSDTISRMTGGLLVSAIIVVFSAPPAAVIWRTPSLHRVSYYYVMVLCLLDCLLGAVSFTMVSMTAVLGLFIGGIPRWTCTLFEAVINCCMNSVSVVMLALGRDRHLSLKYALRYPLLVTKASVWRHFKMAALYGSVHGAMFVGARAYFSDLSEMQESCDSLNWLMSPQYRIVAVVTVFSNIFLDIGTIIYNARLMHSAWKLKKNQVQVQGTGCEEAQLSQHMCIFIFTFKLACVFLVCSLPYKLAVLLSGLGAHSSLSLIKALGMVRMLYHILDGWTFCANSELLDAMKAMFGGCCCRGSGP